MTMRDEISMGRGQRIRLELKPSLKSLGLGDDAFVVINNLPAGVHLSAGYGNGDRSWSIPSTELDALEVLAPDDRLEPLVLNVRVVSLDPVRDNFASTVARFDIRVEPDGAIAAALPNHAPATVDMPNHGYSALPGRPNAISRSRADRYLPLVDSEEELPREVREASRALVRSRDAGFDNGEAARFARAMARWQAEAMKVWAYREAELLRRQQREMMAARLRVIDGDRKVDLDQRWSSKFAELMAAQDTAVSAKPQERDNAYRIVAGRAKATP